MYAEYVIAVIVLLVGLGGAYWLVTAIWYWTRVGWRWARRNPPRGRFW